jgi:hypothetical protein
VGLDRGTATVVIITGFIYAAIETEEKHILGAVDPYRWGGRQVLDERAHRPENRGIQDVFFVVCDGSRPCPCGPCRDSTRLDIVRLWQLRCTPGSLARSYGDGRQ